MKMEFPRTPPDRPYRADLDGLRAIAILSVVLYHAGVPWISGGFTGVDIFFVISGYLIGGHIVADILGGSFSFFEFYRLRAKRILPAFYAMLAVTTTVGLVLLSPHEAQEFAKSACAAALSASNIYFWRYSDYFETQNVLNPMLMTWSLGIEEQFYALVPVAIAVLMRVRRNLMLPSILAACAASFFFAWHELPSRPTFVFYILPARAWELGLGVALAVAEITGKRRLPQGPWTQIAGICGAVLMLAPVFLLRPTSPFPGAAALPTVLGTALVVATAGSWISRMLSRSPLVFIGRISYSWYLWHWPTLAFLRIIAGGDLPPTIAAGAVAASLALAAASYFFIEQPFRKSTTAPIPLLLRYALMSVVIVAALAAISLSNGIPQRYPRLAQIESSGSVLYNDPCIANLENKEPDRLAVCYPSDSRPLVALWGDSHAAALASALRPIASSAGYGLAQLTMAGCRPVSESASLHWRSLSLANECFRFNRRVLDRIEHDSRIRIVIIADAWGHVATLDSPIESVVAGAADRDRTHNAPEVLPSNFQMLQTSIRAMRESGEQVIVLGDVPSFDFDPLSRVLTSQIPLQRKIASQLGILNEGDVAVPSAMRAPSDLQADILVQGTVAATPGVTLIQLRPELCDQAGQCAFRKNGRLLYFDFQHLSPDGAREALRDFQLPAAAR
jgi:peptidoglycan/LPS O-acetylase OafA/YrhL